MKNSLWWFALQPALVLALGLTILLTACGGGGGGTEVKVGLSEWSVTADRSQVKAGKIQFVADNDGTEPHELVIIKTDLAVDALPVVDDKVDEDRVDIVDEIEPFSAGTTDRKTVDLEPGRYVLICNIVERLPGMTHSHYLMGMRTVFTVTE